MSPRRLSALLVATTLLVACGTDDEPGAAQVTEPVEATTSDPAPEPTADGAPDDSNDPATATPSPEPAPTSGTVRLVEVASGFDNPLQVLDGGDGRLWVVEQPGRIRAIRGDQVEVVVDLTDRVTSGGERGLLGVALPEDPDDDRVFVHYSGQNGRTTLSSFSRTEASIDQSSEQVLLTVDQPASNHNGGALVFGPDGMLYLGLGDGGAADDRFGNGQRPETLLGTILRLDVTGAEGYAIPPDNPFVEGGGAPEVWAYGLRNPWRFAFGDDQLFIADVGQNAIEEVDAVADDAAGVNYGWPITEGAECFQTADCDTSGLTLPVVSYQHSATDSCSIIGGVVHEGASVPWLDGYYLYADLCSGLIRGVRVNGADDIDEVDLTEETGGVPGVLGFGTDARGETHLAMQDGRILRLAPDSGSES